ncbi:MULTISPECIES: leucine zipper domain-containing protein [Pseudonocardiaceae]|uniref:leucine zipper domain-containing protein n=1 Tax=Pseudonocardiaceae TaxID=2070 RepID=UPI003511E80D
MPVPSTLRRCASKWAHRYRRHGELGLIERSSTPHRHPVGLAFVELRQVRHAPVLRDCPCRT